MEAALSSNTDPQKKLSEALNGNINTSIDQASNIELPHCVSPNKTPESQKQFEASQFSLTSDEMKDNSNNKVRKKKEKMIKWSVYKEGLDPKDANIIDILTAFNRIRTRSTTQACASQSVSSSSQFEQEEKSQMFKEENEPESNFSIEKKRMSRSVTSNINTRRVAEIKREAERAYSLGEICTVTLQYVHEIELSKPRDMDGQVIYPIEVRANEMSDQLRVQRRRMYDVLHVLEAIGVFQKRFLKPELQGESAKEQRPWQHLQQSLYYWGKSQTEAVLKKTFAETIVLCDSLRDMQNDSLDKALMIRSETKAKSENWPALTRITSKFLNLAIADGEGKLLLLQDIAERIHDFSEQQQDQAPSNDIGRRLYDVVSVLTSCNIVIPISKSRTTKKTVMLNYSFNQDPSELYIGEDAHKGSKLYHPSPRPSLVRKRSVLTMEETTDQQSKVGTYSRDDGMYYMRMKLRDRSPKKKSIETLEAKKEKQVDERDAFVLGQSSLVKDGQTLSKRTRSNMKQVHIFDNRRRRTKRKKNSHSSEFDNCFVSPETKTPKKVVVKLRGNRIPVGKGGNSNLPVEYRFKCHHPSIESKKKPKVVVKLEGRRLFPSNDNFHNSVEESRTIERGNNVNDEQEENPNSEFLDDWWINELEKLTYLDRDSYSQECVRSLDDQQYCDISFWDNLWVAPEDSQQTDIFESLSDAFL